jgi:hypothetical protein
MADYNKAIELDPQDANAFYNRGMLRQVNGDAVGGRSDIARARQLKPNIGKPAGPAPERTQGQSVKIEFTVDAFMAGTVYGAMSREDFCDVVLAALRAGNLSDDDATFAVYAREWVISNADQRQTFVEWMASEVRARMSLLQSEWLQAARQDAAIRRMSFNEWYTRRK